MELTKLGWNADLNRHFAPYAAKGLVPARVAVEDKLFFRVWTADAWAGFSVGSASGAAEANDAIGEDSANLGPDFRLMLMGECPGMKQAAGLEAVVSNRSSH